MYVLGALSSEERDAYERHLAGCAECQAEVAEFGDLPELLGKLDPGVASWAGPSAVPPSSPASSSSSPDLSWAGPSVASSSSPSSSSLPDASWAGPSAVPAPADASGVDPLLPRVLDRARRSRRTERRRRRWQTAGTALVAACLGVLAVLGVRSAGFGQPDFVAMQEVAATVPVTASLALEGLDDGTLVRMRCAYKPAGGYGKWTYKLYVVPKSGEPEELDSWTAGAGDEYELKAHSQFRRDNIQKIEIRGADGTALLALDA
ncbi:zf-HC2 domain-containing protein [Dactylosporangium sp. NPDC050588]|uniref:anti-sigma factor family protein n=1 Tax=Dactylosporangium sp. NPDC050588 TaxID=3157211 RepID=UPI0033CBC434